MAALGRVIDKQCEYERHDMAVLDLREGWLLATDLKTTEGLLLVKSGQQINASLQSRLVNWVRSGTIAESLAVLIPAAEPATEDLALA